jgi:hypothetical protein
MKVRIIKDYTSEFSNPLKLKKDDKVQIDHTRNEYPGWKYCKTNKGQGWIAASYLEILGDEGTLNHDYDATELTVKKGQLLEMIYEESGWLWCKTEENKFGWCPKIHTEVFHC